MQYDSVKFCKMQIKERNISQSKSCLFHLKINPKNSDE